MLIRHVNSDNKVVDRGKKAYCGHKKCKHEKSPGRRRKRLTKDVALLSAKVEEINDEEIV